MERRFAPDTSVDVPLTVLAAHVSLTESTGKAPGLKDPAPVRRFPFF